MNNEKREIKKLKANALSDLIAERTTAYLTDDDADNEGRPLDYSPTPYSILMSQLQAQVKDGHNFF